MRTGSSSAFRVRNGQRSGSGTEARTRGLRPVVAGRARGRAEARVSTAPGPSTAWESSCSRGSAIAAWGRPQTAAALPSRDRMAGPKVGRPSSASALEAPASGPASPLHSDPTPPGPAAAPAIRRHSGSCAPALPLRRPALTSSAPGGLGPAPSCGSLAAHPPGGLGPAPGCCSFAAHPPDGLGLDRGCGFGCAFSLDQRANSARWIAHLTLVPVERELSLLYSHASWTTPSFNVP